MRRHAAARRSRVTPAIVTACLALLVALLVPLVRPHGVAAFELPGCDLLLTSVAADGTVIDVASSGSRDASQDDPLLVAWDGTVEWQLGSAAASAARTAPALESWRVQVFGIPTPLGGSGESASVSAGSVSVGGNAPFRVSGLFYVSGSAIGDGGSCSGGGWLKVIGSPAGTVPFFVGLALGLFGAVLAAAGARGRLLLGVAGGVLAAAGLVLLAVSFAFLPLGPVTPLALLLAGMALGLLAGWWGHMRVRDTAMPREAPPVGE